MPRPKLAMAALAAAITAAAAPAAAHAGSEFRQFASPAPAAQQQTSPGETLRRARQAWRGNGTSDLTPVLRRLALQLPQLSGAKRREAQALLARPTDGAADPQNNGYAVPEAPLSPSCGARYCVHWV